MTRIKTMYSKLKNWHKAAILVGFFVIVTVALLYMNQPSTKVTLFKNLSETSQTQVTDELGKIGVDYTIDKNGDILVDKSVEKLVRDKMEEDGIPYTGTDGNDILLNSSLGASEEDKKNARTSRDESELRERDLAKLQQCSRQCDRSNDHARVRFDL